MMGTGGFGGSVEKMFYVIASLAAAYGAQSGRLKEAGMAR